MANGVGLEGAFSRPDPRLYKFCGFVFRGRGGSPAGFKVRKWSSCRSENGSILDLVLTGNSENIILL